MGFLHSGSNASNPPHYTNVQVQTSAEGMVVPVIYGRNRVAPNLVWADNFQGKKGGKKGGGKGGGKGSGNKTYYTGVVLAVCEGPISYGFIFIDNSTVGTFGYLNLTPYIGTSTQTPADLISTIGSAFVPMAYRNTAYLASNSYDLGAAATLPQHNFEIHGFFDSSCSISGFPDANPATFITDLCTNTRYGLSMPSGLIADTTQYATYCLASNLLMSPVLDKQEQFISTLQRWAELSNTWIFWSENQMKFVPLGTYAVSGNGVTYTPVTTIQYDLGYDDFIVKSGEPPLTVLRGDISKAYNWVKVNARHRINLYNAVTVEWKDLASISQFGAFQAKEVQADEVCDRNIAQVMATFLGERSLYLRNEYKFTLGWNYCLLEPGDIVSLNDPALNLVTHPVRIKEVAEDKDGNLTITAEECPTAFGAAATLTPQPSTPASFPSSDVDPGSVNPPAIYEPDTAVTAGQSQIWVGASGGSYWGGATVYASIDDVTYAEIGTIDNPIPQGVLLSTLASHADPDTTDTLSIDLTESLTVLSASVTDADADAGRTLALVDGELIAYGAVAPNITNSYSSDLTYLRRGFYGSLIGAHAAGSAFSALTPSAMLKVTLPASYVGKTVYLKLTSFNLFGSAEQDISLVTRYSFVPVGRVLAATAVLLPLVNGDMPVGVVTNSSGVPIYVAQ